MEDCMMRECTRKLALWHTRTFKPLLTHDDLDSLLATRGFVGLPPSSSAPGNSNLIKWKEYVHDAAGTKSVTTAAARPRLPHPRIDGLHMYTYRAFIDAVNFYLEMDDISTLFHVRGMPLHRIHDRNMKWVPMEEDESIFVYRDGTLDQSTLNFYSSNKHHHHHNNNNNNNSNNSRSSSSSGSGSNGHESMLVRNRGKRISSDSSCCIVSLKDVIV